MNITDSEIVAGYQATANFDPTVLRYVGCKNGDFLTSKKFTIPPVVKKNSVTLAATSKGSESNGNGSLATLTFEVVQIKSSTLMLSDVLLTDSTGVSSHPHIENAIITEQSVPTVLKEDVNEDGVIDNQDLELVGSSFGKLGKNSADVNEDGVVNIADLTLVQKAIEKANATPSSNDE